jgi:DNA polymerase III delta prime subunit
MSDSSATHQTTSEPAVPYQNGLDHLLAEMSPIRKLLEQRVREMTAYFESEVQSPFRGYGITPTEAMEHIRRVGQAPVENEEPWHHTRTRNVNSRLEATLQTGQVLPLVQLQRLFMLNGFELDVLLTCLMPEFFQGFERVFGFLQDDATLTYPTIGLLQDLFCQGHAMRAEAVRSFHSSRPLKFWRLLVPVGEEMRKPPRSRAYRVDHRIVNYLMGSNLYTDELTGAMIIQDLDPVPAPLNHKALIENVKQGVKSGQECIFVHLQGYQREDAVQLIGAVIGGLGWRLIKVPLAALFQQKEWKLETLELVLREAVLQPAALLFYEENLLGESRPDMTPLLSILSRRGILCFYQGQSPVMVEGIEPAINYIKVAFKSPTPSERLLYWQRAIENYSLNLATDAAEQLVMRYPLSEQQINKMFARLSVRLNGNGVEPEHAMHLLTGVINDYSQRPLDELAQKIDSYYDWNDLVLHRSLVDHLKAFRNNVAHQFTIYEKWGFGAKESRGRGVVALFSGRSGTGKTMAAEVIANDLRINLYRIDLASVVSKYIGETEKNLKNIFDSARGTSTLLFFDEADSLFGRRTDIHDAHDRYANLEVNYLLQKLEEHDGPVILATNRRKNIDEAFLRRIHFIVEFPLPSEPLRQVIWQKKIPARVPKADDLDINFLARQFEISGGDIKNAALQAMFMAAEDGTPLTMEHLLSALRREYLKMGKHFPGAQLNEHDQGFVESPEARRRKKEVRRLGN